MTSPDVLVELLGHIREIKAHLQTFNLAQYEHSHVEKAYSILSSIRMLRERFYVPVSATNIKRTNNYIRTLREKSEEDVSRIQSLLNEQQKRVETYIGRMSDELEDKEEELKVKEDNYKTYLENTKSVLEEKITELDKLFGLVTDKSVAGEFQKTADSERKAWWVWSILALLGFVGLIVYSLVVSYLGTETWLDLTKHFLVISGGTSFTAYSVKQASDHKMEARRNRMIQMKIQSINPYLKGLDTQTGDIKEIKAMLAHEIFLSKFAGTQTENLEE